MKWTEYKQKTEIEGLNMRKRKGMERYQRDVITERNQKKNVCSPKREDFPRKEVTRDGRGNT